jgi:CheY-like chemotaxis protein
MTKLLVVDDKEQNRYLLQTLLMRHGYDVILAADGLEALKVARDNPPDMIVSDILMPGMDGYALCRQWRRDDELNEIPFVFYTVAYTNPEDEQLALRMGAARFIRKPQEQQAFLDMIEEVIEEHKAGRQPRPLEPVLEETVYFKEYNEALIRKLEDKLVGLDSAKTSLERERAGRNQDEGSVTTGQGDRP